MTYYIGAQEVFRGAAGNDVGLGGAEVDLIAAGWGRDVVYDGTGKSELDMEGEITRHMICCS